MRRSREILPYGIHPYVVANRFVLLKVFDPLLIEACLPDFPLKLQLALQLKRVSAFEELHAFFQRMLVSGSKDCVEMIGHDHEFVQQHSLLCSVVQQDLDKKGCTFVVSEDGLAF